MCPCYGTLHFEFLNDSPARSLIVPYSRSIASQRVPPTVDTRNILHDPNYIQVGMEVLQHTELTQARVEGMERRILIQPFHGIGMRDDGSLPRLWV